MMGLFAALLVQGVGHAVIHLPQYGCRVLLALVYYDVVQQVMANHAHEGTRYAMAGAVHHGQNGLVL